MNNSWLITGGCGFLGTNLIRELKRTRNVGIRIVDNLSVGSLGDLAGIAEPQVITAANNGKFPTLEVGGCQFIEGDISDPQLALDVSQGIDVIVHFAANTGVGPSVEDPRADCIANVFGTFNYLDAARKNNVKKFIFASSGAPAGEVVPPIHEELAPHPVSPYGASKLAGEGYCSAYSRTFGIDTVSLRFGNVYGPGSTHKSSVVAKFIKAAMRGEKLEVYGDGSQTRDFIYVDDLIRAVILATEKEGVGGETFQIATSRETTLSELLDILIPLLDESGVVDIEVVNTDKRLGDVMRNYSDTRKAKERLGWSAEYDLEDGVRKTIGYFLSKREAGE